MAISTILWKIRVWPLCLLLVLLLQVGCTMGVNHTVRSSYSMSGNSYLKIGYLKHNDPWRDIWPMITFDNGVTIKIHPDPWYSFTHSVENCDDGFTGFGVTLYSDSPMVLDVLKSYFVSQNGEAVLIGEIRNPIGNDVLYPIGSNDGVINITKSQHSSEKLHLLWDSGDHKAVYNDMNKTYLGIKTEEKVGCAFDYYRLYLSFRDVVSGESSGYWLYFFPVEYKTFGR